MMAANTIFFLFFVSSLFRVNGFFFRWVGDADDNNNIRTAQQNEVGVYSRSEYDTYAK
jgi:hypothetical protein